MERLLTSVMARHRLVIGSEFYVRWYQYWYQYMLDSYVWGALEDKSVLLHDRADTMTAYVETDRVAESDPNSGPGRPFVR